MENKIKLKDWATLIAGGIGMTVVYYAGIATIALVIGVVIASFTDVPWLIAWLFAFLTIRFVIGSIDAIWGLKSTRCPECRQRIQTTNPVKCVDCGGPALLVKNRKKENNMSNRTAGTRSG